ncbi:MAG TPA: hypoxanthine phosphoribosyltransferase, partial [Chloroflexota bacterium]|nr:hypoxanthine phosphoribosyltransferase [Chloroflexota bacterium]
MDRARDRRARARGESGERISSQPPDESPTAPAVPGSQASTRYSSRGPRLLTSRSARHLSHKFVHPSEEEFARIMDFYQVDWVYEPRSFPLKWEGDRVTEMFTPDFYLPDLELYVELTTMKQSLVTKKNRKLRELQGLYPEVNIRLLYRKDYQGLLAKYGYRAITPSSLDDIERVLYSAGRIQRRVAELAEQITRDYAGKQLLLIGILKGVAFFMTD